MMLPYVVTAVLVIRVASTLESPPMSVGVIAAVIVALIVFAAMGGSVRPAIRWTASYLGIGWDYFRIRQRWIQFVPPFLLWPILMVVLWWVSPTVHTDRTLLLREYSSFLQTAAQVLIALLIALAIEVRTPKSIEDKIAIRPATGLTVLLLAVAELACLAVLSPFLPAVLDRWTLYLVIASGISAILALVLLSWRILGEDENAY
jgi:uncharacterized membrane protein